MEPHDTKEKYVVNKLTEIVNEFKQLFFQSEEKDVVPLRMQLVGGFTIIDVLGNYWFEYLDKKGKPSERFYEFVEKFCLTDRNKVYKKSFLMKGITKERLCKFRNSLVHFYGFGEEKNFAIAANPSKTHTPESIKKMAIEFRKKIPDIIFVQPIEFRDLIVEGAILMLEEMIEMVHKSQTDFIAKQAHIAGTNRIYNKLFEEGAEGVK